MSPSSKPLAMPKPNGPPCTARASWDAEGQYVCTTNCGGKHHAWTRRQSGDDRQLDKVVA